MKNVFVAPIAEGKGEVEAVPKLLHRIFQEVCGQQGTLNVNPVLRVKAGSFVHNSEYLARYVELAARKAKTKPNGSVLILLDSEDVCPAELGPHLLQKATQVRADVPIIVALAYREYETWFLAAAESLRNHAGLPNDLTTPGNPEAIRGAKEWLSDRLPNGYDEINHQPLFTQIFSLDQAAKVDSFRRLREKCRTAFSPSPYKGSLNA